MYGMNLLCKLPEDTGTHVVSYDAIKHRGKCHIGCWNSGGDPTLVWLRWWFQLEVEACAPEIILRDLLVAELKVEEWVIGLPATYKVIVQRLDQVGYRIGDDEIIQIHAGLNQQP